MKDKKMKKFRVAVLENCSVLKCLLLLTLVLSLAGCGGSGFSVGGKVAFPDGSPLPRGEVLFTSSSFSTGGDIISDGSYNLRTRVPAGTYKVSVKAAEDSPADAKVDLADAKPAKLLVDLKYSNPETSGLTCEVKGLTTFDFKVEKPAKK